MLVAVDTGGTKTLVAVFSPGGKIAHSLQFKTPKTTMAYLKQLEATIRSLCGDTDPSIIIAGIPGVIKDGVAVWCGNLSWTNFAIQKELSVRFPHTNVAVENDANLAGLAEAHALSPMPTSVLYVTISTGIGTGIITNGQIDPGLRLSEGGHMLIEYDGAVRLWESFASGKAIYTTYGKYARDITSRRVWNQIADRISRGFLAIIPLLQPDVIVIGGSIGTYFDQFGPQLEKLLIEKLPDHIVRPVIERASHPEEAVIYGCYHYGRQFFAT